jgi:nucleotide-binding universal stress UspA family protein
MTYRDVLVGTDGSPTAAAAVHAASRLAVDLDVPLTIVTAWQRHLDDPPAPSEEARYPGGNAASQESHWSADVTSDAAAIARTCGVRQVDQAHPIGHAADALLEVADRHPEGLLVVGTAGLTQASERLVGNVPHQLTHHSPIDLLLVTGRRRAEDGAAWRTVGLATDGSRTAATAVRRGLALAQATGATPVLVTVAKREDEGQQRLARTLERLDAPEGTEQRVHVGGDIARGIRDVAADLDLLVLGNKGMTGPSRLLGSVANRITHQVPTDLLLVNTTRR